MIPCPYRQAVCRRIGSNAQIIQVVEGRIDRLPAATEPLPASDTLRVRSPVLVALLVAVVAVISMVTMRTSAAAPLRRARGRPRHAY
jgi:hypothetical protein